MRTGLQRERSPPGGLPEKGTRPANRREGEPEHRPRDSGMPRWKRTGGSQVDRQQEARSLWPCTFHCALDTAKGKLRPGGGEQDHTRTADGGARDHTDKARSQTCLPPQQGPGPRDSQDRGLWHLPGRGGGNSGKTRLLGLWREGRRRVVSWTSRAWFPAPSPHSPERRSLPHVRRKLSAAAQPQRLPQPPTCLRGPGH